MIPSANDCQTFSEKRQTGVAGRKPARGLRRGQALVEFAIIAIALYILIAGTLTFGHALYVAQGLQTAADLGAREISRTPLPANPAFTFENALDDTDVRERIFDAAWLVVNLTDFYKNFDPPPGEMTNIFRHLVPQMPLLNQQLATLMIVDERDVDGDGTADLVFRYPGALVSRNPSFNPPSAAGYPSWVVKSLEVQIPLVSRTDGVETGIELIPVVEEIEPSDPNDSRHNPFLLSSDSRGVVAFRINYPFQSASMSSFRPNPAGPFEPTVGSPNLANEVDSVTRGTHAGANGLGVQQALGQRVRPYRRVISAQAIYRREVFE